MGTYSFDFEYGETVLAKAGELLSLECSPFGTATHKADACAIRRPE